MVTNAFFAPLNFQKPLVLETLYFRDGKRKVDLVLAYEDNGEQSSTAVRRRQRRTYFESSMEEEGLNLELEDKTVRVVTHAQKVYCNVDQRIFYHFTQHSQDGKTYFLKVHAPWEVITRCAELMNLKMPIKEVSANALRVGFGKTKWRLPGFFFFRKTKRKKA